MTASIEALAEKAVEARNAYKIGSGKPDTEDRLWHAHRNAMEAFRSRATPEAWLALTARNRELEQALALLGPVCTPIQDQPSEGRTTMPVETYRAMTARIAELEEALRPFGLFADAEGRLTPDYGEVYGRDFQMMTMHPDPEALASDLRRAARALSQKP